MSSTPESPSRGFWILLGTLLFTASTVAPAIALDPTAPPANIASLKGVSVPEPSNLYDFIKDKNAAIKLGKALFWDQQVGSDGTACASCHFHGGADTRVRNQLSPGLNGGDTTFGPTRSGGVGGPNYTLNAQDFPFHQLADVNDRNSEVLFDANEVSSSSGMFLQDFVSVTEGSSVDACDSIPDPVFHVNGINVRQVEPRNTPTVNNAALNFRNFWDGRANEVFNGVDPFGKRNPDAKVLKRESDGTVSKVSVAIRLSSLASQAVGPPLSSLEMSCAGRTFRELGRKMLSLRPLSYQRVAGDDSVLGSVQHASGYGLSGNYGAMIEAAFHDMWWADGGDHDGYTHMQHNFALFWGLALQMYQGTLITDDTRFDRFMEGQQYPPVNRNHHLTLTEREGLSLFVGKGKCVNCHAGPELTKAGVSHLIGEAEEEGLVERMFMGDADNSPPALYDNGFYNIGVRPTAEDIGVGGVDPWGNPLSFTRQYLEILRGNGAPDMFEVDPCKFEIKVDDSDCSIHPDPDTERVAVDGAFKTPGLRGVELTGPFFHNGGQATLEQVVWFYNRGGDRRGNFPDDTTGTGPLGQNDGPGGSNLDPDITNLGLNATEIHQLATFMGAALTDERIRYERAPFDHPELRVQNGHDYDENTVVDDGTGRAMAVDREVVFTAVGAGGRSVATSRKFLQNPAFEPADAPGPDPDPEAPQSCREAEPHSNSN